MKVIALNGSARKNFNSAEMLKSFVAGVRSVDPLIDVELIHVYDLDYKGCRGCLGCQMKRNVEGRCVIKDDAYDLLERIKNADGFVFASPIYFMQVTAHLEALFERLFYPGKAKHEIPVTAIYTMNQPEEVMIRKFRSSLDITKRYLDSCFNTDTQEVMAFQTLQWRNNAPYKFDQSFFEERKAHHDEQWALDLKKAYEAGQAMAERMKANENHRN